MDNGQQQFQMALRELAQVQANINQIVAHVNKWVAKIQGIDSVAYAALLLHGDKEFKLDDASVEANSVKIQEVLAEMARYREWKSQEAEKEMQAAKKQASKEVAAAAEVDGGADNTVLDNQVDTTPAPAPKPASKPKAAPKKATKKNAGKNSNQG